MNKRQEDILRYIIEYTNEKSVSPSTREILKAVGVKSTSTISKDINYLKDEGYLATDENSYRSIRVVNNPFYDQYQEDEIYNENNLIMVPILGHVAAGQPIYADDHIEDYMPLPAEMAKRGNLFILTVQGDSMINIGIYDGDKVIVREQTTAKNGDIVVAMVEDSATVKTFYKKNGHIELRPENDTMSPMVFEELSILGLVIGLYREMV